MLYEIGVSVDIVETWLEESWGGYHLSFRPGQQGFLLKRASFWLLWLHASPQGKSTGASRYAWLELWLLHSLPLLWVPKTTKSPIQMALDLLPGSSRISGPLPESNLPVVDHAVGGHTPRPKRWPRRGWLLEGMVKAYMYGLEGPHMFVRSPSWYGRELGMGKKRGL